jgi:hypothetical protein
LTNLPVRNIRTEFVNCPDNFVSWDSGIFDIRKGPLFYYGFSMANAAGLDFDAYFILLGLWDFLLHQFEIGTWLANLNGPH